MLRFWQSVYKTETGELNLNGLFGELLANKCRITTELLSKILNTCIELNLLYQTDEGRWTSHGIKKRIGIVSKEREGAIQRQEERKENINQSKVKDCPSYSANNSDNSANNKQLSQDFYNMQKIEKNINEKRNAWRDSFDIYRAEAEQEFKRYYDDDAYVSEREKYHPGVDIRLSMKKAFGDFWGTESGWHHKKKKKCKEINWKSTINNAIELNRVWKPRIEQTKPTPPQSSTIPDTYGTPDYIDSPSFCKPILLAPPEELV
jgi:hypothetical protein